MTLPHTYKDSDGDEVHVDGNSITVHEKTREGGPAFAMALLPHESAEAAALAKAVLEAAGDTGHEVISTEELAQLRRERALRDSARIEAARAMRDRALELANDDALRDEDDLLAEAIRALPLLPDA